MPETYVLDAYALLALLSDDNGADEVADILADSTKRVLISSINVGEVYYILYRRRSAQAAQEAEAQIFQQPNLEVIESTWDRVRSAAEIKAGGGLSFADSFAAALAREASAPLVTGDPEFRPLERQGMIQIIWLLGK